ncbi:hypothetical protein CRG98_026568, partial [Punica granatum]
MTLSYLQLHPPPTLSPNSSSSAGPVPLHPQSHHLSFPFPSKSTSPQALPSSSSAASPEKWRAKVSFFPAFLKKGKDAQALKEELLDAIAPLDRGAEATPEDQQRVDEMARRLEAANPTKEPLKSPLLNGKWELIYTTSQSILQTQ